MVSLPPEPLGAMLRGYRHAAGMTLEELSAASGVSDRAIGDMERGRSRGPQERTVRALAVALGLGAADADRLLEAAREGRRRNVRDRPDAFGLCDLPPAVPDFTGRTAEIEWLTRRGAEPTGRPLVISGGPGLGKTALVVRAAHLIADRFADGAFYLNLRGLDALPLDPHDALARLLGAFGVRGPELPMDREERHTLFRRIARDRDALVLLDNAADETQLRSVLPGAGHCTFWITSRRALTGLEHVRRLPLTPLPDADATTLLETITASRSPTASDSDRHALERIAHLCGGLPLALRIAGNRLVSRPAWSAADLADRLSAEDLRLDRLSAGDLRVESAFTLSYEQLTPSCRLLFRRLSLIPGPDFAPSLGAVLTTFELNEVEHMMNELIELGLLNAGTDDRAYFHDLIRLYAQQRLREEEPRAEHEAARSAMNSWLLETARAAGQWFEPGVIPAPATSGSRTAADLPDRESAQAWLQAERANWLAALHDAADAGRHRTVVDVAQSMHWFSLRRAYWDQWHAVFTLARASAHALGDPGLEATIVNCLSWSHTYGRRQPDVGLRLAREAEVLAHQAGDPLQEAWALVRQAFAAAELARYGDAVPRARRAADLFRAAGDKEGYAQALLALARHLGSLRRLDEAVDTLDVVVGLVSDPRTAPARHIAESTAMSALSGKALALLELGEWKEASEAAEQALALDARVRIPELRGSAALSKARAARELGEEAEAVLLVRDAVRSFTEANDTSRAKAAQRLLDQWPSGPDGPDGPDGPVSS